MLVERYFFLVVDDRFTNDLFTKWPSIVITAPQLSANRQCSKRQFVLLVQVILMTETSVLVVWAPSLTSSEKSAGCEFSIFWHIVIWVIVVWQIVTAQAAMVDDPKRSFSINAGNSYWRGRFSTVNLLILTSLDQLLLIFQALFSALQNNLP